MWLDHDAPIETKIKYKVTPMQGKPGALVRRDDLAITTNIIILTEKLTQSVSYCFNNGILATQNVSRMLRKPDGTFDFDKLMAEIKTPGSQMREYLSANMPAFLMSLVKKAAAEGGRVYLALYELADPELLQCLCDNAGFVSIILSNTGPDDEENKPARAALEAAKVDLTNRYLGADEIGHNKLVVYVDAQGVARITLGSCTNWTPTGMCTQTNNAALVESDGIGDQYLDYWHQLRADSAMTPVQSAAFRAANAVKRPVVLLADGSSVQVWFSPNTQVRTKPKVDPAAPPDMAELIALVKAEEEAVFGLFFNPGHPSVLDAILEVAAAKPHLVARAAVSTIQALTPEQVTLLHRAGEDPVVVPASGIHQAFANYLAEIDAAPNTHAIIHNKNLLLNPLAADLSKVKVAIMSHNAGYKASYQNDENIMLFTGNRALALVLMVHIFDVTTEYRFNWATNQRGADLKVLGFLVVDDSWQDKYLVADSTPRREIDYVMRAGAYLNEQTLTVTHAFPLKAESLVAPSAKKSRVPFCKLWQGIKKSVSKSGAKKR